jgi:hypothetical protein
MRNNYLSPNRQSRMSNFVINQQYNEYEEYKDQVVEHGSMIEVELEEYFRL